MPSGPRELISCAWGVDRPSSRIVTNPRPLTLAALAAAAVLAAAVTAAGAASESERIAARGSSCELRVDTGRERLMVRLINGHRARAGQARLKVDPRIRAAGRRHSRWITRSGSFSHERQLRWARGRASGQNLALGRAPRALVRAMMASSGHRANLLSPVFRRVGVGAIRDCRGRVVYTVNLLG